MINEFLQYELFWTHYFSFRTGICWRVSSTSLNSITINQWNTVCTRCTDNVTVCSILYCSLTFSISKIVVCNRVRSLHCVVELCQNIALVGFEGSSILFNILRCSSAFIRNSQPIRLLTHREGTISISVIANYLPFNRAMLLVIVYVWCNLIWCSCTFSVCCFSWIRSSFEGVFEVISRLWQRVCLCCTSLPSTSEWCYDSWRSLIVEVNLNLDIRWQRLWNHVECEVIIILTNDSLVDMTWCVYADTTECEGCRSANIRPCTVERCTRSSLYWWRQSELTLALCTNNLNLCNLMSTWQAVANLEADSGHCVLELQRNSRCCTQCVIMNRCCTSTSCHQVLLILYTWFNLNVYVWSWCVRCWR